MTTRPSLGLFVLITLACLVLCTQARATTYNVTISKIDDTEDGHGTTRTTVRHVFRFNGYWYVFCGDHRGGQPGTYYAFFVTSTDGINWSARKVGTGGGVNSNQYGSTNIPETPNQFGDTVYGCYGESNELRIRAGTLSGGEISWTDGYFVAPSDGVSDPPNVYGYYPDIMAESDGRFSMTFRHMHRPGTDNQLDPAFVVSTNPDDITSWQAPRDMTALTLPERTDGHENIPLPGGQRVLIYRTHNGVYEAGTPGNFLAFHFDGSNWSGPVDLGDSDGINGSDKRHSGLLDPGTGIVHLTYIEDSGTLWDNQLRHRTLSPPYGTGDWSAPTTVDTDVFTVTLGLDATTAPARIAAIYGDQMHAGTEDPNHGIWGGRLHTGEIYLKWFDGTAWEPGRQLISETGDEYAWYPSVMQDASGTFGVLYQSALFTQTLKDLMFVLLEPVTDPPTADFTATPTNGPASLDVTFTDLSTDPDGTIVAWSWDFGDTGTSTDQNPVHTYTSSGTFTISLTVTDNHGGQDTETKTDYITVTACVPDCTGRDCGDDGCGGICGTCDASYQCDAQGQCAAGCQDADNDGHDDDSCGGDDCNDDDDTIHPGAEEICDDTIDQDCDGADEECKESTGCGCGATDTSPVNFLLLLAVFFVLRRRC